MQSVRLVTSKSNLDLANRYMSYKYLTLVDGILDHIPAKSEESIFAFGGGSVIDTAKIMAGDNHCMVVPTTASGACMTSWAVVWQKGKKFSVQTKKPILVELYKFMDIKLPKKVLESTYFDCLAHIIDSRSSKKSTDESLNYCDIAAFFIRKWRKTKNISDLIEAGNFGGRAIEITGTNFYHSISYILTLDYGLDHGQALKEAMLMRPKYNWNKIIKKAQKYDKFFEVGV